MKLALVGCHAGLHNKEQAKILCRLHDVRVHTLFGAELTRTINLDTFKKILMEYHALIIKRFFLSCVNLHLNIINYNFQVFN